MIKGMMISRGSGNVFADLGLPDAEEHQLKAQIITLIARIIDDQHLTQNSRSNSNEAFPARPFKASKGRFPWVLSREATGDGN